MRDKKELEKKFQLIKQKEKEKQKRIEFAGYVENYK